MADKREQLRLVKWQDLEESYRVSHGQFRVFVEVPAPEDSNSRAATKNFATKIRDLLESDKMKNG